MKKLFIIFSFFATIVLSSPSYAQTITSKVKEIPGKPSYNETVEFINTFLNDNRSNVLLCAGVKFANMYAKVGEQRSSGVWIFRSNSPLKIALYCPLILDCHS